MGKDAAAAATAVNNPAKSANTAAQAEPTLADLGRIIGGKAPAAAAKPAKKTAAPAADNPDKDPDFDDDDDDPAPGGAAGGGDDLTDEEKETLAKAGKAAGGDGSDELTEEEKAAAALEAEAGAELSEEEKTAAAEANENALELDAEDKATRQAFTPEQQKKFDKAVQKKHRKVIELQGQLAERDQALEQLAAAPAVAAIPTADNPLADVEDEATLQTAIANSRSLWRWARLHPNGGTLKDAKGGEIEITPERALEIQVQEEELLNQHAPARAQFLKDRSTQEASAVQAFPWLKNKNSQGSVEIEAMLRRSPALRTVPGIKLILADHLSHRAVRLAKKTATAGAKPAVQIAPGTPAGRNPPPKVAAGAKQISTALKSVAETGRDPGNAALGALIRRKT